MRIHYRGMLAALAAGTGLLLIGCSGQKADESVRGNPVGVSTQGKESASAVIETPRETSNAAPASGVAVAGGAAVDASSLGKMRILLPKSALATLKGARIVKDSDGALVREVPFAELENVCLLPVGQYKLSLLFANPNYQPPTAGPAMGFEVKEAETTDVAFGAVTFTVKNEFVDLNLDGIRIVEQTGRIPPLELRTHGNDYYLFKPKAVPAGDYTVELLYYRSPNPTTVRTNVSVPAGAEIAVTLDAAVCLDKPAIAGVLGWDLLPAGGTTTALEVRRGTDNDEPLWRKFIVPPGKYDLRMHMRDLPGPVVAGKDLEIAPGSLLKVTPSL